MRYHSDDIFFTVQEVSKLLKISALTIYKYIREQQIEAIEVGGHFRIPKSSLDTFLQKHKVVQKTGKENSHA